jgi:ABC-type multidrug transport system ATPase subunit
MTPDPGRLMDTLKARHRGLKFGLDSNGSGLLARAHRGRQNGEKQLLTIARAFLARPSVLILDEATSSVDTRLRWRRLKV